jgi:hypothetical protein
MSACAECQKRGYAEGRVVRSNVTKYPPSSILSWVVGLGLVGHAIFFLDREILRNKTGGISVCTVEGVNRELTGSLHRGLPQNCKKSLPQSRHEFDNAVANSDGKRSHYRFGSGSGHRA